MLGAMTGASRPAYGPGYQVLLATLLSLNFGIVFFDRNALSFLMPFVQPDLGLSNTQVGLVASALSLTWACAAFLVGVVSDAWGSRKGLLVVSTLAFSACSFATGLAPSFLLLLGARMLMGVAEGGIMPISQSLIASEVAPRHRGLAMGVTQNFGSNLLGSFLAPVVLVAFAKAFGWRHAFYLAAAPGFLSSLLIWWFVRESAPTGALSIDTKGRWTLRQALAERNVLICALLSILLVSYLVICWVFMPLYLTRVRHYDVETMGWLMGTLGLSATLGAFLVSALSDRIGRRPLMIATPFIGVALPLAAMYFQGSVWVLAGIFFISWSVLGIFPLFMATVPSESVDPRHVATVLGVCMGSGEILGGVLAPSMAGLAADRIGLTAPVLFMIVLALCSGVLAIGLRETAPRLLAGLAASAAR
jgi:predicted MFS family arabinose efflux permease